MQRVIAGPDIIGKVCPYCQSAFEPGGPLAVCTACRMPHHAACWAHNHGCTTFGCSEMPYESVPGRFLPAPRRAERSQRRAVDPLTNANDEPDFSLWLGILGAIVTAFLLAAFLP